MDPPSNPPTAPSPFPESNRGTQNNSTPITLLQNRGGIERNSLNNFVHQYLDSEETDTFPLSFYYDLDTIATELQPFKNDFIILSINTESLMAKIDKLREIIHILNEKEIVISAIALQETWLSKNANLSLLLIEEYHEPISQGYICGKKGGLAVYVHSKYKKPITQDNIYKPSKDWEALVVDITNEEKSSKITICNIYRPPRDNYSNASLDKFLTPFETLIRKLVKQNSFLTLCGDTNINLLRLQTWKKCQDYFDHLLSNSFLPNITLPTRFSKHKATLIDHIFCREKADMCVLKSGILMTKISDHLPCFTVVRTAKFARKVPKFITVNANSQDDIDKFKHNLALQLSDSTFENDLLQNPNVNYDKLYKVITECKQKYLPTKKVRFNKYKHKASPWITYGIIESIKQRDRLLSRLHAITPRDKNYSKLEDELKEFSARLQNCRRKAKKAYYKQRFDKCRDNIKETWKQVNIILGKRGKDSEYPTHLIHEGQIVKEDAAIAQSFNDFFVNIGPKLANEINISSNRSYKTYLTEKISSSLSFDLVDVSTIEGIIGKLKSKSSSGLDGISANLLKNMSEIISSTLTIIINQSLTTGIFPDRLKCAKVVPIYKKDNPHLPGNYRPISLLPAISKVFEKVVYSQVYEYLSKNNLLYKNQYGFRKKHSTELAAMEVSIKIFENLDKKKLPLAIFLDFSKAFDTIDHEILLYKLSHYGIKNTALAWFKSYLSNRTQFVQYKDIASGELQITTGVPQGSILGPLLFIIYINDIAKITNKFHFTIYADDTTLLEPLCTFKIPTSQNIKQLTNDINKELEGIVEWLGLNKLSLNVKKTKMMLFHYKQRNVSAITPKLKINGILIEKVKCFNFLGITIDENMTWKPHTQKVACKIAATIGTMKRLKNFLPRNIMKMLYDSLVLPHLTYGIILWGKKIKRIVKLQKWALRTIECAKYNAHTDPILNRLKLLRVNDIYKLTALKIFHKYKNNTLPPFFNNIFEITETPPTHSYELRQRQERLTSPNTVGASQSPKFLIPNMIKEISPEITNALETESLKSTTNAAKQLFINSYPIECTIENCYVCNELSQ